ncbi:hypothetical protein [Roseovarius salinarum]|uniref:hypothetical protein n=1 Tax=Roseovarius salinarum TaxID=1981892 RepID=UPI000C33C2DE|nr:hypothetical protein [Roseovarius salinarum]
MYAISLTSIPPRFPRLGPVLESLLAQRPAPAAVYLCLPRRYRRFAGPVMPPALPAGVTVLRCETDHGPATKALVAARHLGGQAMRLIYCDDDWIMPKHWAARLLAATGPHAAAAGSGFSVARLKRHTPPAPADTVDIAQGFAGVAVDPAWFASPDLDPPAPAWPVDDIWLSGQLARRGVRIRHVPHAAAGMQLAFDDGLALQDSRIGGQVRAEANLACAALLHGRYGIWPPMA